MLRIILLQTAKGCLGEIFDQTSSFGKCTNFISHTHIYVQIVNLAVHLLKLIAMNLRSTVIKLQLIRVI